MKTLALLALLISQPSGFGPPPPAAGDSALGTRSISTDGRYVAFVSTGDGLSEDDDDTVANVYLRDRVAKTTTLVSRDLPEGVESSEPSISGDGALVAFTAGPPERKNGQRGRTGSYEPTLVYVRDVAAGTTTLVSRASGDGAAADSEAREPALSRDGRFVAFSSEATNLGAAVTTPQIWRRELGGDRATVLISRAGTDPGNYASSHPDLSADGNRVAFQTLATNLGDGDLNGTFDVYLRDVEEATTTAVTTVAGGDAPSVSAAGDRVAFVGDGAVRIRSLGDSNQTRTVAPGTEPSLSGDGTRVAFTNESEVRVATVGAFPVTVAAGATPALSADGTTIAFTSSDDGLRDDDPTDFQSVYAAVPGDAPDLVSRPDGEAPWLGLVNDADPVDRGAISADGGVVVFASAADGLSETDDNTVTNVFARDTRTGVTQLLSVGGQFPVVSADGTRAAFLLGSDVMVTPIADPHPERVSAVAAAEGAFAADASLSRFAYRAEADRAVHVADAGGEDRVAGTDDEGTDLALSGDGTRLAYDTEEGVAVEDLATDAVTPVAGGRDPALDATGAHLAYATFDAVVVRDLAAGTDATFAADEPFQPALSADGATVAYGTEAKGAFVRRLDAAEPTSLGGEGSVALDADGGCAVVALRAGDFLQVHRLDLGGDCPVYAPPPPSGPDPVAAEATTVPTGSPAPVPSAAPVRDTVAPVLTRVSLRPRRFRRRTTLRLTASEPVLLVVRLGQQVRRVRLPAGRARLRVRRGHVRRGRHRLRLRAFDAAGNASRRRSLRVRIRSRA